MVLTQSVRTYHHVYGTQNLYWDRVSKVDVTPRKNGKFLVTAYSSEEGEQWVISEFTIIYYVGKYVIHGMYKYNPREDDKPYHSIDYYRYGVKVRENAPYYRGWNEEGILIEERWNEGPTRKWNDW